MIPNNQWWFNSSNVTSNLIYSLRPLNLNTSFDKRDGLALVAYNGRLIMLGGWNGTPGVFTPGLSTNQIWESTDAGYSWTQLADAPWIRRHQFGCEVMNGKIWVFGGDDANSVKDVWTFDDINGWVLITSDWGIGVGQRILFNSWTHGGYLYIAGGQDAIPATIYYKDVYRSSDGVTWVKMGDLDLTKNYSTSVSYVKGNIFYVTSGGAYVGAGIQSYNNTIQKSIDFGVTWTTIGTLPVGWIGYGYAAAEYYDNKFWYLEGSDISAGNQPGLYYSSDEMTTWTKLYDNPVERHAEQLTILNDKLYIVAGNMHNDSLAVEKVSYVKQIPTGTKLLLALTKLNASYTGYAVKVRRSSDNTTQDIGFIGNNLDTVSLLSFVGAGDGYVDTWYDQGGMYNFNQAITANQPYIVMSGVLVEQNGSPAIYYSARTQELTIGVPISLGTNYSFHTVINMTTNDSELLGCSPAGYGLGRFTGLTYHNSNTSLSNKNVAFTLSQQNLIEFYRRNLVAQFFENASPIGTSSGASVNTNNTFSLFSLSGESASYNFLGYMQVIIIYDIDVLDLRQGLVDKINEIYGIY